MKNRLRRFAALALTLLLLACLTGVPVRALACSLWLMRILF